MCVAKICMSHQFWRGYIKSQCLHIEMINGAGAILGQIDHGALQAARARPYRMSLLGRAVWCRTIVCGVYRFDVTETQLGKHEAYAVKELEQIGCPVRTALDETRMYIEVECDARSRQIFGAPSSHEIYGVLASFYCRVGRFHAPGEPYCVSQALGRCISRLLAPHGYVVSASPLPGTQDVAVYLVGIDDASGKRVRMSLPRPLLDEGAAPRGTEFEWRN